MAKKKEIIEPLEKTSLEVAQQAIIKKYGPGVIGLLGSHEDLKIDAVSTGSLALDSALNIGGFARGRLYEVYGPNSSGKSTLALSVCMEALKRSLSVAYIDAEHSLDPRLVRSYGKAAGVDPDRIVLIQAYTGDDNLEIGEILMKTGALDVLVIDSVSALLPKSMADGDISDNYIGLLARLMSKACIKLTPIANYSNTMLIFINQIRHNIGKWGDDRTPTGGEALSFYTTGRIRVEGGESKSSHILDNKGVVVGHYCDFTVIKNKLAAPWRSARVGLIYGRGYDFVDEAVTLGTDLGLIDQAGAWFTYGTEKFQGKENVVQYFRNKTEDYDALRKQVKDMLGLL
jgi:recombination protein RecA